MGEVSKISPYVYSDNNPILFVDPRGTEKEVGVSMLGNKLVGERSTESSIRLAEEMQKMTSEKAHTILDLAGMVEGLGSGADAVNAIFYGLEGDFGNAAVSGLAIIPFLGSTGTGARVGLKLLDIGADSWKPAKKAYKLWKKGKKAKHFTDHGAEFGAKNMDEYTNMALGFAKRKNNGQFVDYIKNDTFYRFEKATSTVFVGSKNGTIKTFYKWDGRVKDDVINTLKEAGKF